MSKAQQHEGDSRRETEDAEKVYWESQQRLERGEPLDLERLCREHPALADGLRILHSLHGRYGEPGSAGSTQDVSPEPNDLPIPVPGEASALAGLGWSAAQTPSTGSGSTRFCILCGREIGDQAFCSNPDCDELPNYYRHVPMPREEPRKDLEDGPAVRGLPGGMGPTLGADRLTEGGMAAVDRQTLPVGRAAVAVLRRTVPPHDEHQIHAGRVAVGARLKAGIIIDEPNISSRHACIECQPDPEGGWRVSIVDLKSTNGTHVNGKRVARQELKDGDRVRFATIEYEIRMSAPEGPRVTLPP